MYGAIFSKKDVRDYEVMCNVPSSAFPSEFELKLVRVKSQGKVGSCVAHSLSSIIEYYNNKQNHDNTEMSVGYIYGNRISSTHKGVGMIVRDALEAARTYGDIPREVYLKLASNNDNPEVPKAIDLFEKNKATLYKQSYPHRISQYNRVKTVSAIKASLQAGNPVLIAINWYSDITVKNGILTTNFVGNEGGHCMIIYGWNEIGWKVQNSWGKDWGNNGCVIIPYDFKLIECWTLTDEIIEGTTIKKPFSSPLGKRVAKVVNNIYEFRHPNKKKSKSKK